MKKNYKIEEKINLHQIDLLCQVDAFICSCGNIR